MGTDYKKAGVDIEAGDRLVDWLQTSSSVSKKGRGIPGKTVQGIGGFAALFRPDFKKYKKPLLVTGTDGIGTKVLLAAQYKRYEGVGQDLVAMCANDLATIGADPMFFLDYYAVGKLDLDAAKSFLTGVRKACEFINCALIGGETAEMPGVYRPGDFDSAGFIVGVVDEQGMPGPKKVKKDDVVLGISSSGFHSNGFSLLRKVFEKDTDQWIDQLLIPTALYGPFVRELMDTVNIHAMSNITGGGVHNIPRVLPKGLSVEIQDWEWPNIFREVQARSKMSRDQMLTTLNCGMGFTVIVSESEKLEVQTAAKKHGFETWVAGALVKQAGESRVVNVKA